MWAKVRPEDRKGLVTVQSATARCLYHIQDISVLELVFFVTGCVCSVGWDADKALFLGGRTCLFISVSFESASERKEGWIKRCSLKCLYSVSFTLVSFCLPSILKKEIRLRSEL